MKIPDSKQMHELDTKTIEIQKISSTELMERASTELSKYINKNYNKEKHVVIFCGTGNNGGDGLCIARILYNFGWNNIDCYLVKYSEKSSADNLLNYEKLKKMSGVTLCDIHQETEIPELKDTDIVIDAIFGTGLNRGIEGLCAEVIKKINESGAEIIAIDIPSGLSDYATCNEIKGEVVKATQTLTIQSPTVSMLLPENQDITGDFKIIDINLDADEMSKIESCYNLVRKKEVATILKPRKKFSHKGTFGHALLIAGAYGKAGASVLASKACHRTGVGLLTTHVPQKAVNVLQTSTPETMISIDSNKFIISQLPDITKYNAIGVGPGIGKDESTAIIIKKLLKTAKTPLVLDADALNIISAKKWHDLIPENSILTPHPKEFERLFGKTENSIQRLNFLKENAVKYKLVIILKGAHTAIATPDGQIYFNNTGNPGMATAGSGDVLTGIITALLAQKYSSKEAAILGVWLHGKAGDLAAEDLTEECVIASDIINYLPQALKKLKK